MARIDPDILGRLFDEHAAFMLLFARQWCDAPEDIVQDAFVVLARQKAVPDRVVPWLYRVVRNGGDRRVAATRRRRRREERAAGLEAVQADPWFASTDDQIDAAARLSGSWLIWTARPVKRSSPGSGAG